MKYALWTSAAAAGFLVTAPAQAAVTIFASPGAVQPSENVLLPTGQTGATVKGFTNNTQTEVTFRSLNTDILTTPANGAARIETTETTPSLDTLEFFLSQPGVLGFTAFEFNLSNAIDAMQTLTLTFTGSQSGTFTSTLGSGSNFFSGLATGGDFFTKISFDATGVGTRDLRQVRVSGIVTAPTSAVPEPATWAMMLIGFGLIGSYMRRRKTVVRGKINFA